MTESQVVRLIALYRTALKLLAVSTVLAVVAILAELAVNRFNLFIPFLVGGGVFSPYVPLVADLIALPGVLWLYRSAQSLRSLDSDVSAAKYSQIWAFQKTVGSVVTLGAIIMIPGSLIAIQMGIPGLAILLPIFGGAWVFSQARKINRDISIGEKGEVDKTQHVETTVNPYLTKTENVPPKDARAGMALLFGATLMLVINIFTEFSLVNDLRNTPEFFGTESRLGSVSWTIGYSAVADVLIFGSLGIAVLVFAVIARKRIPQKRFIAIVSISALQLALVSGSAAPTIAHFLGPSQIANDLQAQADQALETYNYLRNIEPPAGFEFGEGQPFSEDENLEWGMFANTGVDAPILEKCTAVVDYAFGLGATEWMRKDTRETGKVSDRQSTINACVATLDGYPRLKEKRVSTFSESFLMGGVANFEPNTPLTFDLTLMNTDPSSEKPNTFVFELYIMTANGMDPIQGDGYLSQGTVEINELLNIIGQARLANPNRNPTEPAFMREILSTYKYDIKLQLFESRPGVADRIELTSSDGTHICLSVEPWNEKQMAQADPGWGYGLGGMYENLSELKGFGGYKDGGCSK